jgi:hypothetical protein
MPAKVWHACHTVKAGDARTRIRLERLTLGMAVHQRIASGAEVVQGPDVIFGSRKTAEGLGVARLKEFVTL